MEVELKVLVSMMSAPASRYCAVDVLDDLRLGEVQQVVVALQVAGPVLEALAAKSRFVQMVALDHGAHGAIEDDDAFAQEAFECLRCVQISAHKSIVLPWVRPTEREATQRFTVRNLNARAGVCKLKINVS